MPSSFVIDADDRAHAWLEAHSTAGPRVIALDVSRCCGGAALCRVRVRDFAEKDRDRDFAPASLADGTAFLIDRRAAMRLPRRFGITVRGLGRFRHLDLSLTGEQWGELLYP